MLTIFLLPQLASPPPSLSPTQKWYIIRRVSKREKQKKKKKKKVIRANIKLFHLYFATFLVENVFFSASI